MKIYYWKDNKNFGDLLSSFLIKRFTRLDSEWAEPHNSDLVLAGSVLDVFPKHYRGVIAGAGKLHEETILRFPEAKILAVRGPLTAKGLKGNFILADPGLLANELVKLEDKEWDLGIVPHWTDNILEHNPIFHHHKYKIIRVEDHPLKVISEIGKCRKIVSSSLHGIILADAFNIPRRIEIAPRMITHKQHEGGLFKWMDYSESLGVKLEIGILREINRNIVTEKQHELFDVMEEIKAIFSKNSL